MLRNAIWDFDGTLCDTYPAMSRSMQRALADMGIERSRRDIEKLMRISMAHSIQMLALVHHIDADALAKAYERQHATLEREAAPPFPGVKEALERFIQRGGNNYVMTHRGASAREYLAHFGLETLFAEIVTSEAGFPRKPAPNANLYLLDKWGLRPEETVMIGDRELDIQSGHAAGTAGWLFAPEGPLPDTQADWVFRSYAELIAHMDEGRSV